MLVCFVTLLIFVGCDFGKPLPNKKIDGVVRVLMHEPRRFTLLIKEGTRSKLTMREFSGDIEILCDVPVSSNMWAEASYVRGLGSEELLSHLIIHVHSQEDVNAGGWNHGKDGSGQTQIIE